MLSLTAAYENGCEWCDAFHTAMALKEGVDRDVVDALRQGTVPDDACLAALTGFARVMVRNRAAIDSPTLQAFFAAGYSKQQALDVVMGMAFSNTSARIVSARRVRAPAGRALFPAAPIRSDAPPVILVGAQAEGTDLRTRFTRHK